MEIVEKNYQGTTRIRKGVDKTLNCLVEPLLGFNRGQGDYFRLRSQNQFDSRNGIGEQPCIGAKNGQEPFFPFLERDAVFREKIAYKSFKCLYESHVRGIELKLRKLARYAISLFPGKCSACFLYQGCFPDARAAGNRYHRAFSGCAAARSAIGRDFPLDGVDENRKNAVSAE